jgi:hypothetical protein
MPEKMSFSWQYVSWFDRYKWHQCYVSMKHYENFVGFNDINMKLEFFICFEFVFNLAGVGVVCKTWCSTIHGGTGHIDCIFMGTVLSTSACVVLLPLYLIFITPVVRIIDAMQIIIISHYCFLYMPVALFNFHIFTGVILCRLKLIFCDWISKQANSINCCLAQTTNTSVQRDRKLQYNYSRGNSPISFGE